MLYYLILLIVIYCYSKLLLNIGKYHSYLSCPAPSRSWFRIGILLLQHSQKETPEDVSLDVFLMNGHKITVNIKSTDQTDDVLEVQIIHQFYCIPEKRGYYGSRTVIIRVCRDFLVFNLQATFLLGFLLNFACGLLWQRSGHPIILVAQESELCSGESKMSTILINFEYCLCSSRRAQFHFWYSDVVRFDLWPLLQSQMRIAKVKSAYNLLIIGPRSLGW